MSKNQNKCKYNIADTLPNQRKGYVQEYVRFFLNVCQKFTPKLQYKK